MEALQVTQALSESETSAKYLLFGEMKEQGIIPIEQACAKCEFWKGKFRNVNQGMVRLEASMKSFAQSNL